MSEWDPEGNAFLNYTTGANGQHSCHVTVNVGPKLDNRRIAWQTPDGEIAVTVLPATAAEGNSVVVLRGDSQGTSMGSQLGGFSGHHGQYRQHPSSQAAPTYDPVTRTWRLSGLGLSQQREPLPWGRGHE